MARMCANAERARMVSLAEGLMQCSNQFHNLFNVELVGLVTGHGISVAMTLCC